jgi:hypothetical protein
MAIATTTALAIGGMAISAGTAGMSFAQAGKQRKLQRQAESEAAAAMDAAKKRLDVNFYEQLAIQKEPYELEREALLSAGAQAIEAGQESERGAAATAGRVMMAQQAGQRQIAGAMGQEMLGLEKATAAEDSRLAGLQAEINLGEAKGAELAARDAQQAANLAVKQGMEGVTSLAKQALSTIPLFSQNPEAQKQALGKMNFTPEQFQQFGNVSGAGGLGAAGTGGFTNLDFDAIKNMSNTQYNQFKQSLTPQQRQMLFTDKQYLSGYNFFNPY